jgi:hypothetical protein
MSEQRSVEYLKRLTPLLGYLPKETLEKMLALVRETRRKLEGVGGMPASATEEMAKAVPDELVRAIVSDLRNGPGEPGWLKPRGPVPMGEKGSGGWAGPPKAEDPMKRFEVFDRMVAGLIGGPNDTSRLK